MSTRFDRVTSHVDIKYANSRRESRRHGSLDSLHEGSVLVRVDADVASTVELAVDVHLRKRGPLAVDLHPRPEAVVLQDVHSLERDVHGLEDLHHGVAEPALRLLLVALHEEDDLVLAEELVHRALHLGTQARELGGGLRADGADGRLGDDAIRGADRGPGGSDPDGGGERGCGGHGGATAMRCVEVAGGVVAKWVFQLGRGDLGSNRNRPTFAFHIRPRPLREDGLRRLGPQGGDRSGAQATKDEER